MVDFLTSLLPQIEHFHAIGYWIAFFAALLETTLGIGLLIPGSTTILFLGALSARGYLDVGDLIWSAVIGAIIGDNINYYLGKRYGSKWTQRGFWFLKPEHFEKAKVFFDSHGGKSVFIARFIPNLKEIVPFIAGSLNMRRRTFFIWNILGAIGWGFEWVGIGYFFAQSLSVARTWLSRTGFIIVLLLTFIALFFFLKRPLVKHSRRLIDFVSSLLNSII